MLRLSKGLCQTLFCWYFLMNNVFSDNNNVMKGFHESSETLQSHKPVQEVASLRTCRWCQNAVWLLKAFSFMTVGCSWVVNSKLLALCFCVVAKSISDQEQSLFLHVVHPAWGKMAGTLLFASRFRTVIFPQSGQTKRQKRDYFYSNSISSVSL